MGEIVYFSEIMLVYLVEKDLQEQNMGLWTAWFYAQDRVRWRKVAETATLQ